MHVRWLRSLTRITYLSKLIGTPSLAACLKLELFRVFYTHPFSGCRNQQPSSAWVTIQIQRAFRSKGPSDPKGYLPLLTLVHARVRVRSI
ncbi:hypothetical protein C9I36_13530 [Pectobacterium punjabense]|nr:hypothetical protein C9I36_13530 [Pectobacterium punjabense]